MRPFIAINILSGGQKKATAVGITLKIILSKSEKGVLLPGSSTSLVVRYNNDTMEIPDIKSGDNFPLTENVSYPHSAQP
jgi:hypothetical protein